MRKSIKSIMAFALAASLAASTLAPATTAQAASKQNVITKATYNDGSTVKYSYNKKGLVTKSVDSKSYKTDDTDVSIKTTTTYKYNKKNKISSKTAKTVTTVKYYNTDKTTGLTITGNQGTVTTTKTEVTKFTYNKKGLATQSETTTTTTKAGETTIDDNSIIGTEVKLPTGEIKYIAGYNRTALDGSNISNAWGKSANAYYYTGNIADTASTTTTKTTYTDNGNGSYTETVSSASSGNGYKTEYVESYYGKDNTGAALQIIPLTREDGPYTYTYVEDEYNQEQGTFVPTTKTVSGTGVYYKRADNGAIFYIGEGWTYVQGGFNNNKSTFSRTESVTITADPASKNESSDTTTTIKSDKTVTTTKYSYDKKKRVKKAVATTVATSSDSATRNTSSIEKDSSKDYVSSTKVDKEYKLDETNETTSVETTSYSYDKKGRAKKIVTSNDGKKTSTTVTSGDLGEDESISESGFDIDDFYDKYSSSGAKSVSVEHSYTNIYDNTSSTRSYKKTRSYDVNQETITTAVANGVKTTTTVPAVTKMTYSTSSSYVSSPSNDSSARTLSGTIDTTRYANGGTTSVDTYNIVSSSTNSGITTTNTTTGTDTNYEFDENGIAHGYVDKYTYTPNGGTPSENVNAYYTDGKTDSTDDDALAMTKIDAAKAGLTGAYQKVKTKTALATPSKETTTYAYDKNGNVKSAKASGTKTTIKYVKDETYGNDVYEFDADGEIQKCETVVTHKYTNKDAMENTVKKGTKNLTKVYTANTSTYDRSRESGSWIKKAAYTIKSKKASAAKVAKKQQWNIQNSKEDILNGQIGLN